MKLATRIPAKYRSTVYVGLAVLLAVVSVFSEKGANTVVTVLGAVGFTVAKGNVPKVTVESDEG